MNSVDFKKGFIKVQSKGISERLNLKITDKLRLGIYGILINPFLLSA